VRGYISNFHTSKNITDENDMPAGVDGAGFTGMVPIFAVAFQKGNIQKLLRKPPGTMIQLPPWSEIALKSGPWR
jgi:hypothetical protein